MIDITNDENTLVADKPELKEGETAETKQAKILIGIPCQEMVNVNFVISLMHLQRPQGSSQITFTQSSILPQSRDTLADMAIKGGYTHILYIDSDMTFPADALYKLFKRNVDICTGLCFARKGDHNPCIYKRIEYEHPVVGNNANIDVETDIDREFFEVKACGMAFCLIKTSVLIDIANRNGGELFRYVHSFGEDLSFCIRALKAGYKIWCDTTIPIGHVGEKIYTKQDYILAMRLKAAQEQAKKLQEEAKKEEDKESK